MKYIMRHCRCILFLKWTCISCKFRSVILTALESRNACQYFLIFKMFVLMLNDENISIFCHKENLNLHQLTVKLAMLIQIRLCIDAILLVNKLERNLKAG